MPSRDIPNAGCKIGTLVILRDCGTSKGKTFVECLCDCGAVTRRCLTVLKRTGDKACCRPCSLRRAFSGRRKPNGRSAFNKVYMAYKCGSRRRGMVWELTRPDARLLFQDNCYYCGRKPAQVSVDNNGPHSRAYVYNGIDRKDNTVGYTTANAVTCCWRCNRAKNSMTVDEFLSMAMEIVSHRNTAH